MVVVVTCNGRGDDDGGGEEVVVTCGGKEEVVEVVTCSGKEVVVVVIYTHKEEEVEVVTCNSRVEVDVEEVVVIYTYKEEVVVVVVTYNGRVEVDGKEVVVMTYGSEEEVVVVIYTSNRLRCHSFIFDDGPSKSTIGTVEHHLYHLKSCSTVPIVDLESSIIENKWWHRARILIVVGNGQGEDQEVDSELLEGFTSRRWNSTPWGCVEVGFVSDIILSNDLIDMYGKCERIDAARKVFDEMHERNVVSWTALMVSFLQQGNAVESLKLFHEMGFRFAQFNSLGALIDLYVKCRDIPQAKKVFDQSMVKNAIQWTNLIIGYAQEGLLEEAMDLFRQLWKSGIRVDGYVLSSVTGLFADFALIEQGKQVHSL
uniref:Pentatricopeptide repeat-containing protein n=1 Tax=Ananas comosus var. bracteatus TaxID=296719 RepID=A0A6V7NH82_ANACO|nr:unnamed protein product [Ananas comosus var. bracteatus]